MIVEFNVKNLLGKIPVSPESKLQYENSIQDIVEEISSKIDISKLEKIIIPNDFIVDVLEFQKQLCMDNPSVTDNKYGRAFGKTLYDDKIGKYYVFIDPERATFLMDETTFKASFDDLEENVKRKVQKERNKALNLLVHELAHVEFHTHVDFPQITRDYESQKESLLYSLFDEYYACRISVLFSSESIISYDENDIMDVEQDIYDKKKDYQRHRIELNEFCCFFNTLTRQNLIRLVYVLGSWDRNTPEVDLYSNCNISLIVDDFKTELNKLHVAFLEDKAITMPKVLLEDINRYFESFGVFISQRPEGVYYNIPI